MTVLRIADEVLPRQRHRGVSSDSAPKKTGLPVVLNTSLNRRGEPMICSPDDALNMVAAETTQPRLIGLMSDSAYGNDLQNLGIGDFLVRKSA
jgi:predicted NodU family carbamoyl transferase